MNKPDRSAYESTCRAYLNDPNMPLKPHDYQSEGFCKITQSHEDGENSGLVTMATGTGKTILFMLVAKHTIANGGRVMVLAHTGELLQQAMNAAVAVGLMPALEKAQDYARQSIGMADAHPTLFTDDEIDVAYGDDDPKLVIASVQSMRGDRLRSWPEDHFELVVCDEAHHAKAPSYMAIRDHFKSAKYLGFTATWERGDGEPICGQGQPFEKHVYDYPISQAVAEDKLVRPWYVCLPTDIDLTAIRTTAGDLNLGDLEAAITPHVEILVNTVAPRLEGRRFIGFSPDVGSAEAFASAFCSIGISCVAVSGRDSDEDRSRKVAEFKDGRYQGIMNCQLFTEGTDFPFLGAVVLFRATSKWGRMAQMVGRGLRLFPGKQDCLVFGFNWKTFKHRLVVPVQLFDRDFDPGEMLVGHGDKPVDLFNASKKTKAAREAKKARKDEIKVKVKAKEIKVAARKFDPLGNYDPDKPVADPPQAASWEAKATPGQMRALEKLGFPPAEIVDWTRQYASKVLDIRAKRREAGLATDKQMVFMNRCGIKDVHKVSFKQASEFIGRKMQGFQQRKAS